MHYEGSFMHLGLSNISFYTEIILYLTLLNVHLGLQ